MGARQGGVAGFSLEALAMRLVHRSLSLITAIYCGAIVLAHAESIPLQRTSAPEASVTTHLVGSPLNKVRISATFYLPVNNKSRMPVLVMLPGTDGIDERQEFYRPALLGAGIATFEMDNKTGIFTSAKDRPNPEFFLPFVFSALKALREMPNVDPDRVALLGWSAGGQIALRAAQGRYRRQWLETGSTFSAFIGVYGGCSATDDLDPVPILILVGDKDTYGANRFCDEFRSRNSQVSLTVYPGAHHGFDKPRVSRGPVERRMEWKEDSALDARRGVVEFLVSAFSDRR